MTITIKVGKHMQQAIKNAVKSQNISIEKFIEQILVRYVIDPHIIENEQVEAAYAECGNINLELANL